MREARHLPVLLLLASGMAAAGGFTCEPACVQPLLYVPWADRPLAPDAGFVEAYLVTAWNVCGQGPAGEGDGGLPRPLQEDGDARRVGGRLRRSLMG